MSLSDRDRAEAFEAFLSTTSLLRLPSTDSDRAGAFKNLLDNGFVSNYSTVC
jgi:hypothetical protein